jgi:hypothetical protein
LKEGATYRKREEVTPVLAPEPGWAGEHEAEKVGDGEGA